MRIVFRLCFLNWNSLARVSSSISRFFAVLEVPRQIVAQPCCLVWVDNENITENQFTKVIINACHYNANTMIGVPRLITLREK